MPQSGTGLVSSSLLFSSGQLIPSPQNDCAFKESLSMCLVFVSKFSPASSGLRPLLLRSKPGGSRGALVVCKAGKVRSGFQGQTRGVSGEGARKVGGRLP